LAVWAPLDVLECIFLNLLLSTIEKNMIQEELFPDASPGFGSLLDLPPRVKNSQERVITEQFILE